jgi:hypothetical protein
MMMLPYAYNTELSRFHSDVDLPMTPLSSLRDILIVTWDFPETSPAHSIKSPGYSRFLNYGGLIFGVKKTLEFRFCTQRAQGRLACGLGKGLGYGIRNLFWS